MKYFILNFSSNKITSVNHFYLQLLASIILLSSCTTPMHQEFDLSKLKPEERVYAGNIQVDLNGKKNADLTCDVFVNNDLNPSFRISPSGEYKFKTIKKSLRLSKIACIHLVNNEKRWVYHGLETERIKQPDESKAQKIHRMKDLDIKWTIPETAFQKDSVQVFERNDPTQDIGKLVLKVLEISSETKNPTTN